MKILILLLLPLFSLCQQYETCPDTTIRRWDLTTPVDRDSIVWMYGLEDFTYDSTSKIQFKITKNDRLEIGLFFAYGFVKGWADEIEYHPYNLSQRFPGLFKNGKTFWDGRYDDDGIWDAKHMAAAIQGSLMTVAVIVKWGDLKKYPKKQRFIRGLIDAAKYDLSRRAGFFLSYNVINQNKLFK